LASGDVLYSIFRIKDALESLDGSTVTVNLSGYGSNYIPIGQHGSAGGYGQYVNNPGLTSGSGYGPRVEGPGGKFYKMNYATGRYEPAQHGWEGVIPPGFPNDSFMFGATSGEHVQVTPATQAPSGGGKGGVNIGTVVINDRYDQQSFERMLYRVVGGS